MFANDHNKQALRFHNVEEGENVPTSVSYDDKLPSGVHRDADEGLTDEAVSGRETCNAYLVTSLRGCSWKPSSVVWSHQREISVKKSAFRVLLVPITTKGLCHSCDGKKPLT